MNSRALVRAAAVRWTARTSRRRPSRRAPGWRRPGTSSRAASMTGAGAATSRPPPGPRPAPRAAWARSTRASRRILLLGPIVRYQYAALPATPSSATTRSTSQMRRVAGGSGDLARLRRIGALPVERLADRQVEIEPRHRMAIADVDPRAPPAGGRPGRRGRGRCAPPLPRRAPRGRATRDRPRGDRLGRARRARTGRTTDSDSASSAARRASSSSGLGVTRGRSARRREGRGRGGGVEGDAGGVVEARWRRAPPERARRRGARGDGDLGQRLLGFLRRDPAIEGLAARTGQREQKAAGRLGRSAGRQPAAAGVLVHELLDVARSRSS